MDSNDKENKVSSYIDSLNEEKKPEEHGSEIEASKIEGILETVRLVRILKKPSLSDYKYSQRLTASLNNQLFKEKASKRSGKRWLYGMVSAAAAMALIIILNTVGIFNKPNMVHAMEQAYNKVKAYHGVLEVVELSANENSLNKPQVEVAVDLKLEEADQKSVDAGHSPWKLDPVFVSQVFVSLKISPKGIIGDYPIKYEELKVIKNTGKDALVEVNAAKTPVKRVYLKRLIRQGSTGIWTVVGYDPVK